MKDDPIIRYTVEEALAGQIPELARAFAEGQPYFVPSEQGPLAARYRDGVVALGTTRLDDGTLIQERGRAAKTVETMLERAGADALERKAALERVAEAESGEVVDVGRGISIRHGTTEGAGMTLGGQVVTDLFPLAIAYHLLAFFVGHLIYSEAMQPVREMLLGSRPIASDEVLVESLIDRSTEYVPMHVLGLSRVEPHLRFRVQLFGPPMWHVDLLRVKAPKLEPAGLALDVDRCVVRPAAPAARA